MSRCRDVVLKLRSCRYCCLFVRCEGMEVRIPVFCMILINLIDKRRGH